MAGLILLGPLVRRRVVVRSRDEVNKALEAKHGGEEKSSSIYLEVRIQTVLQYIPCLLLNILFFAQGDPHRLQLQLPAAPGCPRGLISTLAQT